jgi:hypothetical protein
MTSQSNHGSAPKAGFAVLHRPTFGQGWACYSRKVARPLTVIPANAGIQRLRNPLKALDSSIRWHEEIDTGAAISIPATAHGTHRAALPHIYVMGSSGDEVDYGHH